MGTESTFGWEMMEVTLSYPYKIHFLYLTFSTSFLHIFLAQFPVERTSLVSPLTPTSFTDRSIFRFSLIPSFRLLFSCSFLSSFFVHLINWNWFPHLYPSSRKIFHRVARWRERKGDRIKENKRTKQKRKLKEWKSWRENKKKRKLLLSFLLSFLSVN